MLHRLIEVRGSDIEGYGLFATGTIACGETVWEQDPAEPLVPLSTVLQWPSEAQERFLRHAYQVGEEMFAGRIDGEATDDGDYMNHSCDPNSWPISDRIWVARRDITPGEEVTYDYAASETSPLFSLTCRCGTPLCRGRIGPDDYSRLPELRKRYGRHVMSHVLRAAGEFHEG